MLKYSFRKCVIALSVVITSASALLPAQTYAAPPANPNSEWLFYGNNRDAQFYSPLDKINDKNVQKLGLAWSADIPIKDALVGNALVADGVVYQSGAKNFVFANDVRTGKQIWAFDPQYDYTDGSFATYIGARINRGLALWEDKVLIATGDCRMIAIDRKSGKKAWETISCDKTELQMQTGAPHVGGGMVFTGNSCLDSGTMRGFVTAYDVKTGKQKWRWYTVPGDPSKPQENAVYEMAAKTWGTDWYSKTKGCGQVWEVITHDEKLNMVYIGVAGVSPFNPKARGKNAGDELFTNSIVALKADTGEYVWHYKLTPHDGWNLEPMPLVIADLPIKGKTQRVVIEAAKNGFLYVLDAKTGKFISANNFAPVNWATHVDKKTGRPVLSPEGDWWSKPEGATVYGAIQGLRNWNPMAYNPNTQLAYIPIQVMPEHLKADPKELMGGTVWDITGVDTKKWIREGRLTAWDPLTQKARWSVSQPNTANGGVITTAGNLVFQGTGEGKIEARAADTGKLLWSSDAAGIPVAAPTTIEIDGEQILLVPTGNGGSSATARFMPQFASSCKECRNAPTRLLAFKLGGTAQIPKIEEREPQAQPVRPLQSLAQAESGANLFKREACEVCHGLEALAISGSVPDLRRTGTQRHDLFSKIVKGGLLKGLGMPEFAHLEDDEVRDLQAYVINQSWKEYNSQGKKNESKAK
jgi:quinohemoprotein ethanol dehydrogenase